MGVYTKERPNIKQKIQVIQRDAISFVLLDRTAYSLRPYGVKVTEINKSQDTWSYYLLCCRLWRSSRGRASLKLHSPEQSDTERRCAYCNTLLL